MSALDELADFVLRYCDQRPEAARGRCRRGVDSILATRISMLDRHAVLFGFADEIGATAAPGFDPSWQPAPGPR